MTNVLRLFADEPAASPAPVGDFEAVWIRRHRGEQPTEIKPKRT